MRYIISFLLVGLIAPFSALAASYEVAGWIPYWQSDDGIESAEDNLDELDVIYPFVYEVRSNGSLVEKNELDEGDWRKFIRKAQRRGIEVIPTVSWFDGEEIHEILSDDDEREEHIREIVDMVEDGDFDGVNIDYEGKLAETIDYFSEFLEELKDELGRELVTCAIEARTPPGDRFQVIPEPLLYANDYEQIGKHCDWVEIMAYDQQRADRNLNNQRVGTPYIPVADRDWVEKVIELTLEDIPEHKIMLGVPTYGRVWELTVAPGWYKNYQAKAAMNLNDFVELAEKYDVEPGRNAAGEMSFSYFPEDSVWSILNVLDTPKGTPQGMEAAAKALLVADYVEDDSFSIPVNVAWYSDAQAIDDKLELVEDYDLRGVAIFKIDGEEDEDIWDLF